MKLDTIGMEAPEEGVAPLTGAWIETRCWEVSDDDRPWSPPSRGRGLKRGRLGWEMYPGHPNLLPAAFERSGVAEARVVRKPLLSREGANITVYDGEAPIAQTGGTYGAEGHMWQAWTPLAPAGEGTAVLGAWMIGGRCRGMGIREDDGLITRDTGRFVPHLFM